MHDLLPLHRLRHHPQPHGAPGAPTPAQRTALESIAQGGARLSRSLRGGRESVQAGDGSTIHAKPFHVLAENKLIRVQGTSLLVRDVTITTAGRLALATQKPGRAPTTAPGKAATAVATGARRR
ncbi:hypothetical protein ACH47Z_29230 [Streptomyces sp. NPDC020192]|uniref:hypothetical protein n=1 Tax=Streptomyces sp. NPDC020192 TaxID=3365066 RepID=UPI00379F4802